MIPSAAMMAAANKRATELHDYEPLVNFTWALYEARGYYVATDYVWLAHRPYVEGRLALEG
jgi:hypothetical protein